MLLLQCSLQALIFMYTAGITGLSAVEGNLVLAGITGFLAAFLAFQVILSHLHISI